MLPVHHEFKHTDYAAVARANARDAKKLLDRFSEIPVSARPLIEIENGLCRWPCGDLFCAAAIPRERTYCPAHEARAWQTPNAKKTAPESAA